jgi:electron transfer flavoprotein alpha subunit
VGEYAPRILLGGATAVGRALLPRVAVEVHTGLTADCTQLEIDPDSGLLLQTRPAFGGNLLATITCAAHRPQMATVRPGVFPAPPPDPARTGEIVRVPVPAAWCAPSCAWLAYRPRAAADLDLRSAEVIVAAGFGVGGPKGVALVQELAVALGGVLGASRAVVDAGWVSYPHQVGQTGITVQPRLYVACGVSGAIQHLVGMQNSATIVAINRDPEAPILRMADIALAGDLFEIIPELLRQLGR